MSAERSIHVRGSIDVSEVFGPTVQGEGPHAGRRAVFLRLGQCNLDCSWCDTPYTWDWQRFDRNAELDRLAIERVAADLIARRGGHPAVLVITGGEPLIQARALTPLLATVRDYFPVIEVETNGTRTPPPEWIDVEYNVSPKLSGSGCSPRLRYRPEALDSFACAPGARFKFVVLDTTDLHEVDQLVAVHDIDPASVWLMPCGTTSAALDDYARHVAETAVARGFNYSDRIHVRLWGDERAH